VILPGFKESNVKRQRWKSKIGHQNHSEIEYDHDSEACVQADFDEREVKTQRRQNYWKASRILSAVMATMPGIKCKNLLRLQKSSG
jgi:hypothetical protein